MCSKRDRRDGLLRTELLEENHQSGLTPKTINRRHTPSLAAGLTPFEAKKDLRTGTVVPQTRGEHPTEAFEQATTNRRSQPFPKGY